MCMLSLFVIVRCICDYSFHNTQTNTSTTTTSHHSLTLLCIYQKRHWQIYTKMPEWECKRSWEKEDRNREKKLLLIFVSFPFCSDFFDRKMKNSGWDFQLGIYLCTSNFFSRSAIKIKSHALCHYVTHQCKTNILKRCTKTLLRYIHRQIYRNGLL